MKSSTHKQNGTVKGGREDTFSRIAGQSLSGTFEYHLRKTTTYTRQDLTLEDKERKMIWLCDVACPQEDNINIKINDKRTKYQQLAFEMRERRIGYKVIVVPIITACLGREIELTPKGCEVIV